MTSADPIALPLPPPPSSAGPTGAPVRPRRPWWRTALFHGIGVAVSAGVMVLGWYATAIWFFVNSSCDPASAPASKLTDLRLGLLVIGGVITVPPALGVVLARVWRFAWLPWAVVTAGLLVLTVASVASVDQVPYWCF